jgi:hypothetical protein
MKTEKALGGIILAGLLFKFMHWPFAGPLLVVPFGLLTMAYLIGGFYFFSDNSIKIQNLPLSIVSGFFLSNATMAILYKLMFWPMGDALMELGFTTVPVLLAISIWLKSTTKRTDLSTYYNNMIKRLGVMTILVAVFYFTSSVTLVEIIYSDDPERVRIQTQHILNPENEEYRKEFNEYLDQKHPRSIQQEENGN